MLKPEIMPAIAFLLLLFLSGVISVLIRMWVFQSLSGLSKGSIQISESRQDKKEKTLRITGLLMSFSTFCYIVIVYTGLFNGFSGDIALIRLFIFASCFLSLSSLRNNGKSHKSELYKEGIKSLTLIETPSVLSFLTLIVLLDAMSLKEMFAIRAVAFIPTVLLVLSSIILVLTAIKRQDFLYPRDRRNGLVPEYGFLGFLSASFIVSSEFFLSSSSVIWGNDFIFAGVFTILIAIVFTPILSFGFIEGRQHVSIFYKYALPLISFLVFTSSLILLFTTP